MVSVEVEGAVSSLCVCSSATCIALLFNRHDVPEHWVNLVVALIHLLHWMMNKESPVSVIFCFPIRTNYVAHGGIFLFSGLQQASRFWTVTCLEVYLVLNP